MVGFFQKLVNTFKATGQAISTAFGGGGGGQQQAPTDSGRRRTTRRQPTPSPTQQVTTIEQAREISQQQAAQQQPEQGFIGQALSAIGIGGPSIVERAAEERGAGLLAGTSPITPAGGGGLGVFARIFGKTSKVSNAARTGQISLETARKLAVTKGFATNSKTITLTTSWLARLAKNPAAYLAIIGTYPFAGFIKEEALQTLSFATNTATKNKDPEGLAIAIAQQEEILNPTVWDKIIAAIPFANIVAQLKDFYLAARTKLEIDKGTLERLTLETAKAEALALAGFGSAFEQQTVEAAERRRQVQQQQRAADRASNDAYWAEIIARNEKRKADERAADEAYWAGIKQENVQQDLDDADKQAIKDWNAGKSALNFKWLGR